MPAWLRVQIACSRVSRTRSVVILVVARQPTIRRLKTSKMKATYTVPAQVAT